MTVLIVRDEPAVTDTCAQLLRRSGDSVATALNPLSPMPRIDVVRVDASLVERRIAPIDGVAPRRHVRLARMDDPTAVVADDHLLEAPLCEEVRDRGAQRYCTPVWFACYA